MPANQALQNFKKVILNLEPAGDQREAYRDAVHARIDKKVLHSIIIKAVKDELLSKEEADFITEPEEEGFFGPREVEEEGGEIPGREKQFVDWLTSSHNRASSEYQKMFQDPDADALDIGREIYGNMSPELQREFDQDVLIDAIEDKLAEAGMRPKESNLQPFDQYFNEDDKDKQEKHRPVDPASPREREIARRKKLGSAYRPDEEDLNFQARDRD